MCHFLLCRSIWTIKCLRSRQTLRSRADLNLHGWAFLLDVASVGKTTLALRIATAINQRNNPSFYIDLAATVGDYDDAEVGNALRRQSRPNALLILDNVHHRPELARQLWDQWRDHPRESKLLLIATRMQQTVTTTPVQDLAFFEHHITNPAIMLRPSADDLAAIVSHLYLRVRGRVGPTFPPPQGVLQAWHRDFGSALGPFCLAALGHLANFQHKQWELPPGRHQIG